ncbi:MAG TPA: MATE family efflux transporter [Candidatus Dormibacteraeota bacterium]|nr:MATE family efflux transporter [Candidatus Dormibacteraeota bacterium]
MGPDDRALLRLAVPAMGALAAEPLYVLVDTAIVGHLGSRPLAGLAVGSTLLTTLLGLANFLEYGTTGTVARRHGAGRTAEALSAGVQATWLAVATGVVIMAVIEAVADPAMALIGGGDAAVHAQAVQWVRIAALGVPFVCVTLAGQGWLRGLQDTMTPLVVVVVGNVVSAGLSAGLVYGVHMGICGSAVANALAQTGSAAIFAWALQRRGASWRPDWAVMRAELRTARDLSLRTVAFLVSWSTATAVAARMGGAVVAAHQVAIQLWGFLALVLDAMAIAAQAMVGAALGARDAARAAALTRRLIWWGLGSGCLFAVLLAAGFDAIPRWFTGDPAVVQAAHAAWPWFAGMMPLAGIVFALDGVFIGAGDVAFLRSVTLLAGFSAYVPLALLAYFLGWGLGGVWAGLAAFIGVRFLAAMLRTRSGRWTRAGLRDAATLAAPGAAGDAPQEA